MKKLLFIALLFLIFFLTACDTEIGSNPLVPDKQSEITQPSDNLKEAPQPSIVTYDGMYRIDDFVQVKMETGTVDGQMYYVITLEAEMPLDVALVLLKNEIAMDDDLVLMSGLFDFSKFGYKASDFTNGMGVRDVYFNESINVGLSHKNGITTLFYVIVVDLEADDDSDDTYIPPMDTPATTDIPIEYPKNMLVVERHINDNHLYTVELEIIDVEYWSAGDYRDITVSFKLKVIYQMSKSDFIDVVLEIRLYDDQDELIRTRELFAYNVKLNEDFCCPYVIFYVDFNKSTSYRIEIETKQMN